MLVVLMVAVAVVVVVVVKVLVWVAAIINTLVLLEVGFISVLGEMEFIAVTVIVIVLEFALAV